MKNINRKIVVLIFTLTLLIYQGISYAAAPTFDDGDSKTVSVAENTAIKTEVVRLPVTDPDDDIAIAFMFGNPWAHGGDFTIESSRTETNQYVLVLKNTVTLDYETQTSYHYTIEVQDKNNESDSISVTINITNDPSDDTPNNPPAFTDGASTTRSIAENMSGGSNVGSAIAATDSDNDTLTYRIDIDSTDLTWFSINSTTGQLQSNTRFDYETKNSYEVTVIVSDGRGSTDSITVTISITNDTSDDPTPNNPPSFTDGPSTTRSIQENTTSGTNIGSPVSANDSDSGDTLTYSLGGTDAGSFSINSSTGQLSTSTRFDYETKNSYEVTVSVSDGRGGTDSITVTISVTNDTSDDPTSNSAPTFDDGEQKTVSVAENTAIGTEIARLPVTDPDNDIVGVVKAGNPWARPGDFKIESSRTETNQYVAVLKNTVTLDYETQTSYHYTVTVSDEDRNTDSISVTINITNDPSDDTPNNPPVFTDGASTTRSIAENMSGGSNVGSAIAATDSDNDTLTYRIDIDSTDLTWFSINSTTGQLQSNTRFDYETKNSYEVTVIVSDGRGSTDSITVTISITNDTSDDITPNNPPSFTDGPSTTRSIQENTTLGTNISSPVSATDDDSGDTLIYSLGGTDAGSFSIVRTTGQLQTSAALDYETKNSYEVTVSVSDGNGGSDSITVTISITNDTSDDPTPNNPPSFTDGPSTTRSIQENTTSGTNIGSPVSATDDDSGDTLIYSLGGTDAGSFSIVRTTGQLQTSAALDYETKNSYEVTVSVSDGNGGSDSIAVTISITNDTSDDITPNNPPSFTDGPSTTRSIQENTTLGTNISSPVSATDDDSGDTLTYSLGGTDAGSFSIVRTTGQLQTSAALDYETQQSYELTITVSDGNGGSDSVTLTINVTDVDENPPVQQQVTSVPPTDPVSDQQVSETVQQDDVQQPKSEADSDPVQPQSGETSTVGSKISTTGLISFSELMVASESGDDSLAQWIELYNNSDTEAINLKGWQLEIEARDDNGAHRHAIIPLEDLHILPNQTRLIVTGTGRNSEDLSDNRVYNFFDHHSDAFEQNEHQNMVLGSSGLYLKLSDSDGIVSDVVGNLDGGSATEDEPAWELPSGTTEDDVRTSLLRRYEKDTDMPLDGTELNNWRRASELELSVIRYWGKTTDIGNPGYRGAGALPVTLSHFHVERAEPGVVLKWTTESELNNAGFYILRSEKRDGTFKQVNSRMIQGAGTTGERNTYTWMDTTAKPDIVYYYRIEDVSFAGSRNQLATVRTRGQISASEKHITQWGNLKNRN